MKERITTVNTLWYNGFKRGVERVKNEAGTMAWYTELREIMGIDMREAARRCGIPYSTWCAWEYGTRKSPKYIHKYVEDMILREPQRLDDVEMQELSEALDARIAEYQSIEAQSVSQKEEITRSVQLLEGIKKKIIR